MTTWSEKETDFLSGWLGWPASPNRMRRLVMTDREDPRAAKKSLRRCNSSALVKPSRKGGRPRLWSPVSLVCGP